MDITVEKLAAELNITWEQVLYRAYRAGIINSFTREQADRIRVKPRRGKIGTQTTEEKRTYNRNAQAKAAIRTSSINWDFFTVGSELFYVLLLLQFRQRQILFHSKSRRTHAASVPKA